MEFISIIAKSNNFDFCWRIRRKLQAKKKEIFCDSEMVLREAQASLMQYNYVFCDVAQYVTQRTFDWI